MCSFVLSTANSTQVTSFTSEQVLNESIVPNSLTTINTTFSDTGGVVVQESIVPVTVPVFPLPDQSPTEMLSRVVQIGNGVWTVGGAATNGAPFATYDLFALMTSNPFISSVLSNFRYFRSDLEVSIRLNTISLYAGLQMWTGIPYRSSASILESIQARSWLKPVTASAQQQQTVVLTLPWIHPLRWLTVAALNAEPIWLLAYDILSPLVSSGPSTPSSLAFTITCRFLNPKVGWPYSPLTTSFGKHPLPMDAQFQSSHSTSVSRPHVPTTRLAALHSRGDPNQSAGATSSVLSAATLIRAVSTIPRAILGLAHDLHPLLKLVATGASFFDKPETVGPATRVTQQAGVSMSTVDVSDESLPLTLYSTSYLSTDSSAIPEGGAWTLLDVAMRPSLHSQYTFTNTNVEQQFPYIGFGTPVSFLMGLHKFWHGSIRVKLQFVCSSFVSARFIIVYVPTGTITNQTLTNTVSQVVDVRGDTDVSFTLPYFAPTDVQARAGLGVFSQASPVGYLSVTLFNNIISSDSTADPGVDLIMWSAAAPDFQFFYPDQNVNNTEFGWAYNYPNHLVIEEPQRKRSVLSVADFQCDICSCFSMSFPPFVAGCQLFTDQRLNLPEMSERCVDLMKRYQSVSAIDSGVNWIQFPAVYNPSLLSVGKQIQSLFLFMRGGVRYKIFQQNVSAMTPNLAGPQIAVANVDQVIDLDAGIAPIPYYASGTAFTSNAPPGTYIDFTVPWIQPLPYLATSSFGAPLLDNNQSVIVYCTSPANTNAYQAVRDDYQVGFLVPPPPTISSRAFLH